MKAKTINAVISKKFNEFLNSIDDDTIKDLVRKNTIISGGCIASMLLNEEVNDYDLYFRNKETVLAVAHYYKTKFKAEHPGSNIEIKEDEERVKIFIKSSGIIDVREENKEEGEVEKYKPIFLTSNAITLSDKIQLIIRFYGEPAEIHSNYDFVHCVNYWDSKIGVVLNQKSLESLLSKELVYVGSKYPLSSIIRTKKFLNRGWTINAGQYLKMCFQLSKLDLSNIDTLEDQLVGVDTTYFSLLIEALREKEEKAKEAGETFTPGYDYICTIIDKIF